MDRASGFRMPPRGKIQARQILTRSTSSKNSICSKISVCKIVPGKNIPIWTLFRGIHPHQKVTPNESLMMRWWISGCLVPHDSSHNRSQNVQHLRLSRGLLGWSLWHDFGSHLHCLNTLSRLEWNDVSPGLAGHEPCRLIWKIWKVRITGVSAWLYKVCSREFQVWLDFTWLYFYVFSCAYPVSFIVIIQAKCHNAYCTILRFWGWIPASRELSPGSAPCFMAQNISDSR